MTTRTTQAEPVLDESILDGMGLESLPPSYKTRFWQEAFKNELENRVAEYILRSLGEEKRHEIVEILDRGDDLAAAAWFTAYLPPREVIVRQELRTLHSEVTAHADEILSRIQQVRRWGPGARG